MVLVPGVVRDVLYLGLYTRYLVTLDDGGDLVVISQNLKATSMEVLQGRGRRVQLSWNVEHMARLEG
jgi:hypothetical protein